MRSTSNTIVDRFIVYMSSDDLYLTISVLVTLSLPVVIAIAGAPTQCNGTGIQEEESQEF